MKLPLPDAAQLRSVADDLGLNFTEQDVDTYLRVMTQTLDAYQIIEEISETLPDVKYVRQPGYYPDATENPYNAWAYKVNIKGAAHGKLQGKKIAVKDNICIANVPMSNGSSSLANYIPDIDATVVNRVLDAGGEIVGKANCEYLCISGGSHTCVTGPVKNPRKEGYSAGGSSSGCAALLAAKEIDLALGGDQGGSIRIPASFCGIYGMKPTHGLVPYTGAMPIELTLDTIGPMSNSVKDNALLLEVIAGKDGLDPRQYDSKTDSYTKYLGKNLQNIKIAIVKEGFAQINSEKIVDEKVMAAAEQFKKLGATVDMVSIPMHHLGLNIWQPIALEGLTQLMMHGNGYGTNWRGFYLTSLLEAHSNWKNYADEFPPSLKSSILAGHYMQKYHHGRYYAKAQNLSRKLKSAYETVLNHYDLLLLPTTPMQATPLPNKNASIEEQINRATEMLANTAPFNVTGHPALSLPCGMHNGLPIGLMLVAKHHNEAEIYQAAYAFEQSINW